MLNISTIKNLYNKNVFTVNLDDSVDIALKVLDEKKSSAVVVVNNKSEPVGIFTERDVAKKAGTWNDIFSKQISEVMSSPLITIDEEIDFRDAYMHMTENGFRHLVVTKEDGSLAGILGEGDFLRHLTPAQLLAVKEVHLVMSKKVATISKEQSVKKTIEIMTEQNISSIVVEFNGEPVGVFTERDAVRLARNGDTVLSEIIDKHMSSPLKTINENHSVQDAEYIFSNEHIRHLVVVNNENKLSGILTQHDLVKGISGIYVEMLRDTIRKQSDTLHETYNRLEEQSVLNNILNSFSDKLIIACDTNGRIQFTNSINFECINHTAKKGDILDEDMQCFESEIAKIILNSEANTLYHHEKIVLDRNAIEYFFKTSYAPIFSSENILQGFMFTAEDISEEKKSFNNLSQIKEKLEENERFLEEKNILLEQREQQLLDAQRIAHIGNWILDVNSMQAEWSSEIYKIMDVSPDTEVSPEFLASIVYPDDWSKVEESLMLAAKDGKSHHMEYRVTRLSDGETRWVECRGIRVDGDDNTPSKLVGTLQDITQRKIAEAKLREQEELMIAQSRQAAMGEMISMIAHQWRQPLSVISMGVNNMLLDVELESLSDKNVKEYSNYILMQTEHLSKTIDDFRDFFRPNQEKQDVHLTSVIEDTIKVIGHSLKGYNISFIVQNDKDISIVAHRRELIQVLINLISNAKDAISENKEDNGEITISIDEDGENIIIRLCDNGGGVDESMRAKIFNPYFSTKQNTNGTGLGLYMCKIIVEKHFNGRISLENMPKGACFKISIPKKQV